MNKLDYILNRHPWINLIYTQAITIKKHANIQKKTKKHKHIYVNVGEIIDRRGPYRLKSIDCFMKVEYHRVWILVNINCPQVHRLLYFTNLRSSPINILRGTKSFYCRAKLLKWRDYHNTYSANIGECCLLQFTFYFKYRRH
jgi:dihydroorotate dehydrogenase